MKISNSKIVLALGMAWASMATVAMAQTVTANTITSNANITIQGNSDGSTNGEGVFIYSTAVGGTTPGGASISLVSNANGTSPTVGIIGATSITGTLTQTGATSINTTGSAATTIGNASSVTNINSGTNNIGVGYASTNNIGTGSAATTNNIGNTQTATTITGQAGNASLSMANNAASLTVPNTTANANGFSATNTQSTMTGGSANPTRLTLSDTAATFGRASTGAPITVTGVADGRADYDAVNVRQFAGAIASVSAMSNVPALAAGQDKNFGVGLGNFMGKTGLAMGMNMRDDNVTYKLSVSTGLNSGGSQTVVGAGAAWAF